MQAIIAACDKRRAAKEARLRARGIDLMLMTPDQLAQLHLDEWLAKRGKTSTTIHKLMGSIVNGRYIAPNEAQPSGKVKDRFIALLEKSGIKHTEKDKEE